jgi:hypothetical protein
VPISYIDIHQCTAWRLHDPTPQQQQSIIAKESAWIDAEQFAPLDLSAFPALAPSPVPDKHDDHFARDWRDTPLTASANALRAFVSDPDAEALDRAGSETGNADFRAEVRDRRGETTATAFKRANPAYIPTRRNYETIATTLAFNALPTSEQSGTTDEIVTALIDGGFWTVPNLTACYHALTAEGLLDVPAGSTRNLSSAERLQVSRAAQAGQIDQAIGMYLKFALDGEDPDMSMVNDPAYIDVCNDAVYAVFEDTQLDFEPTPERQQYLMRYAGSRPLTLPLLQQAWRSCQANEQRHERSELLSPLREQDQPPSARELDDLPDAAVENLYRASLREYVRSIKGPGVLV